MKITEYIKNNTLYLDGGMGTLLQGAGLAPGELPERWNISRSCLIKDIHKEYFNAGSHVVATNTFGANTLKFRSDELEEIIAAAIANAKRAAEESHGVQPKWVALDVGPTGRMLKPYGDLDFEDAVAVFSETVRLGAKHGADLILIETMSDGYETKAALLAAKESSCLPVFVSNAYGEDGRLMTGASPEAMVAMLEGMGADAIGVNCSLGPKALSGVVKEYLRYASVPVLLKPNAGLPRSAGGKTVYDILPEEFANEVAGLVALGVRAVGGCCGTTPEYISETVRRCASVTPLPLTEKGLTVVSSRSHGVVFGESPLLIGERINPTGKKRFKEALKANDMNYILDEALAQQEKGVHILDVNVGLPDIDEVDMLRRSVLRIQSVTDLPLQIDTSAPAAMESALRVYNGKAMINSVNGKEESMRAVFPLAKKYGGLVVALTLDEKGIPETAEGRLAVAERILKVAAEYGIGKKDIIFDPLALTVSTDNRAALETARAVELIGSELGCHTSLGVSNVSFGLPCRDAINSTFFTMVLTKGLSAAIMNPYSEEMMKAYFAFRALSGLDQSCSDYVSFASALPAREAQPAPQKSTAPSASPTDISELQDAIVKGLRDRAAAVTAELTLTRPPLSIVRDEIIPALNTVGEGFEKKTLYLPQLLMSAEAAKSAFEVIKNASAQRVTEVRCPFVIATVKGDIHDIGKNIVRLILENYGFNVIDLGKDVPPQRVVDAVLEHDAPVVGLSALMTTTVPAMEETVKLIREKAPHCRVIVGGAVLNPDYARLIGADAYAADAMETVRYAEEIDRICRNK